MKLNMGCGQNLKAGYINVDKYGSPDVVWDLEQFPWPWETGAAQEVVFHHSLEHMGRDADIFIGIMKELYRICADGAAIVITVPHARHDDFLGDPTHVRAITAQMLRLFSKTQNEEYRRKGFAATPLALFHDVDFETETVSPKLDKSAQGYSAKTGIPLDLLVQHANNIVSQVTITLRAVKPGS